MDPNELSREEVLEGLIVILAHREPMLFDYMHAFRRNESGECEVLLCDGDAPGCGNWFLFESFTYEGHLTFCDHRTGGCGTPRHPDDEIVCNSPGKQSQDAMRLLARFERMAEEFNSIMTREREARSGEG